MNEQKQLSRAIQIASTAHMNQVDRGKRAYILHPLHVMEQFLASPQLAAIAVLHDTVEDTAVSLDYLSRQGMSQRVVEAVDALTKKDGEEYSDYLERLCGSTDAIFVKIEDSNHNANVSRLINPTPKDTARCARYKEIATYLTKRL